MIYKCENCVNRHNCCENKEQYERTCKTVGDIARAIDKTPDYHCWYSLTIKCDYWVEDKETLSHTFAHPTEKGGEQG
jgi:hypothetical protein